MFNVAAALDADGLRTDGDLVLRHATLHGADEHGTVRLLDALLVLDHSEITNTTGPALYADRLHTDGHMFLRHATLRGADDSATVRLICARMGSQADFTGTQLSNDSGPQLTLTEARVDAALFLPASLICPTGSTDTTRRRCPDGEQQIVVRELVFLGLRDVS